MLDEVSVDRLLPGLGCVRNMSELPHDDNPDVLPGAVRVLGLCDIRCLSNCVLAILTCIVCLLFIFRLNLGLLRH